MDGSESESTEVANVLRLARASALSKTPTSISRRRRCWIVPSFLHRRIPGHPPVDLPKSTNWHRKSTTAPVINNTDVLAPVTVDDGGHGHPDSVGTRCRGRSFTEPRTSNAALRTRVSSRKEVVVVDDDVWMMEGRQYYCNGETKTSVGNTSTNQCVPVEHQYRLTLLRQSSNRSTRTLALALQGPQPLCLLRLNST